MLSFLNCTDAFSIRDNCDALRNIMIVLVQHAVYADYKFSEKEKKIIVKLFEKEFGLSEDETLSYLFKDNDNKSLVEVVDELYELLEKDEFSRARVIEFITKVFASDGWVDLETPVFETIKKNLKLS